MKKKLQAPDSRAVAFVKKYGLLLFAMLASFVFIGICSKSSPLYPLNDWVDVQCFFTVGKSMLHGQVLYADIYEQKGPLLYFVYALAALISDNSFIGVYLLETVTFGLFLYYSAKIYELYLGKGFMSYVVVLLLGGLICVSHAFTHGGSVEECTLFILAYGMYTVLKAVREKQALSFKEGLVNGIFAGVLLWVKFSLLGFYAGLCLFIVLWYLIWLKNFKGLWVLIGQFLLGVAVVSLAVMPYFVVTGSVEQMLTTYFYNNIFLYPTASETSKLIQILHCLVDALKCHLPFTVPVCVGALFFLVGSVKRLPESLCLLLSGVGLVVLTYWGGKGVSQGCAYYDLVLSVFTVFGIIAVVWLLKKIPLQRIPFLKSPILWLQRSQIPALCCVAVLGCAMVALAYTKGENVYLMGYDKEDMPQYKFAQIINQSEAPTLLQFGSLDSGFYYAADVVPHCRFFCTLNIPLEEMWDTHIEYIEAGKTQYLVTRKWKITDYGGIDSSKYELVSTANMLFEGMDLTYYLYQLK